MKKEFYWRCLFFLAGILVLSFGLALVIKGQAIGVGSWDVLHIGLAQTVGLTIGSWSIILGFIILAVNGFITKSWPQLGTYLDMIISGVFLDIFIYLLPEVDGLFMQFLAFIAGIVLLGFGCGMYMVANIGVGPRDTLMILLVQRLGWSVNRARTTLEVVVAVVGFVLGGPIGVGTLIMAFGLGPVVQWALTININLFQRVSGVDSAILG
ncbi:YczE/YyaS/YitT family protein [Solibacillus sp. FSL H8-0538]|uniref:YczE/YyaS/YitT family protein n=1 Tax=Solibacillus sp. FSL H8-0538 TaxID=2921400 RepID=UPI0030F77693